MFEYGITSILYTLPGYPLQVIREDGSMESVGAHTLLLEQGSDMFTYMLRKAKSRPGEWVEVY